MKNTRIQFLFSSSLMAAGLILSITRCSPVFPIVNASPSPSPSAVAITAGGYHSCVTLSNGAVSCWGMDQFAQTGVGQSGAGKLSLVPVRVMGLSGTSVTSVSAGGFHSCAVTVAGGISCWGKNDSGQIGDGDTGGSTFPVVLISPRPVSTLTASVTGMTSGGFHSCAIVNAGAYCWGANGVGQLGDASAVPRRVPTAVSSLTSGVTQVSAGTYHSCAVISGTGVKCWGNNIFGQLGNSTTTNTVTAVAAGTLTTAASVSAGGNHSCAVLSTGSVLCWGNNAYGQLGDGTVVDKTTPTGVSSLSGVTTQIATGHAHTCALISGGTVQCWGSNAFGQLGDGTTTDRTTPTTISGLTGVRAIAAGYYHTCAIITGGSVKCWGSNYYGQIGDGTYGTENNRKSPTSTADVWRGGIAPAASLEPVEE